MEITGIILAGGKSSRMGTDKGLVLLNGKPMVQHVIDALHQVISNVIIISNNQDYEQFGLKVYPDLIKDKGPVGGIYTALTLSKTDVNFCMSCDTPFVSEKLLNVLIEKSCKFDVTVSAFLGKTHPLIGVYKKSALPVFKSSLDNDRLKLGLVNEKLAYQVVELGESGYSESNFYNINTPNDLKNNTL